MQTMGSSAKILYPTGYSSSTKKLEKAGQSGGKKGPIMQDSMVQTEPSPIKHDQFEPIIISRENRRNAFGSISFRKDEKGGPEFNLLQSSKEFMSPRFNTGSLGNVP